MTDPTPKLEYRRVDPAERELAREEEKRALSLGCWTVIGVPFGLAWVGGFLIATWLNRNDPSRAFAYLISALGVLIVGVVIVYESRRDVRARPFMVGLALGVAMIAAAIALIMVIGALVRAFS